MNLLDRPMYSRRPGPVHSLSHSPIESCLRCFGRQLLVSRKPRMPSASRIAPISCRPIDVLMSGSANEDGWFCTWLGRGSIAGVADATVGVFDCSVVGLAVWLWGMAPFTLGVGVLFTVPPADV